MGLGNRGWFLFFTDFTRVCGHCIQQHCGLRKSLPESWYPGGLWQRCGLPLHRGLMIYDGNCLFCTFPQCYAGFCTARLQTLGAGAAQLLFGE